MRKLNLITFIFFVGASLVACSANKEVTSNRTISEAQLGVSTKIETGEIISIKTLKISEESNEKSYGNVGMSVDTGGSTGIHGSIDVATLGRFFSNIDKPTTAQEMIIKKSDGDTVAITQATKEQFKKGDKIKILLRHNKSVVIH